MTTSETRTRTARFLLGAVLAAAQAVQGCAGEESLSSDADGGCAGENCAHVPPDGACDPRMCAASCIGAGFVSGECGPRGCLCTGSPEGEICGDGRDNDGDRAIDEDCGCRPRTTQPCYAGDAAVAGIGDCRMGSQQCVGSGEFGTWGTCTGSVPPSAETCGDARDENCDGTADEGCLCTAGESRPCYTGPPGTEGVGPCMAGAQACVVAEGSAGWGECEGQILPGPDDCDGADDDCDGTVDPSCACPPGEARACYDGPDGTRGVGECFDGEQVCVVEPGGLVSDWGPCLGWGGPTEERCDRRDNDCDGATDPGCACEPGETRACYAGPADTRGVGECHDGTQACEPTPGGDGSEWGPCEGWAGPTADLCDGRDNDCDDDTDERCLCTPGAERGCYDGPAGTRGVGECRDGTQVCELAPGGEASDWRACEGWAGPSEERCCDRLDNDCDGATNEECCPGGTCRVVDSSASCSAPFSVISSSGGVVLSVDMSGSSELEVSFEVCAPAGFLVDVADSPTCNGYGGDGTDFANDAEAHTVGTQLLVYANDYGVDAGTPQLMSLRTFLPADGCTTRTLVFGDQHLESCDGLFSRLDSPYLLRINPPVDREGTPDATWYVGLGRTVGSASRSGSRFVSATLCLR